MIQFLMYNQEFIESIKTEKEIELNELLTIFDLIPDEENGLLLEHYSTFITKEFESLSSAISIISKKLGIDFHDVYKEISYGYTLDGNQDKINMDEAIKHFRDLQYTNTFN